MPLDGPAAVSGVPPSPFTCEWPSTSQPDVKITSRKIVVINAIDDERKRDAFDSTVAPSKMRIVITVPSVTAMLPWADKKMRDKLSTYTTRPRTTTTGSTSGRR